METPAVQVNAEFNLCDLRPIKADEVALRRTVRNELCRLADLCNLEDSFVLSFMDEIFEIIKLECGKFRSGPKEFYPDPRHNVLKIQITMPTRGKVGVVFWGSKVVV